MPFRLFALSCAILVIDVSTSFANDDNRFSKMSLISEDYIRMGSGLNSRTVYIQIFKDEKTGCEYIANTSITDGQRVSATGGITPRLDTAGRPICGLPQR